MGVTTLELIVNTLSFHGQFSDLAAFRKSLGRLMQMKELAQRFGVKMYSHRNMGTVFIMPDMPMQKAVQCLPLSQRRSLLAWLTKYGPFWDDDKKSHDPDDYLSCNDEIVTDTAVGEAAYCHLQGVERHLVSLTPSTWDLSPVKVKWHKSEDDFNTVAIPNYLHPDDLETSLECRLEIASWDALTQVATTRCRHIQFAPNSFEALRRYPFHPRTAKNLLQRLKILDRLRNSFDAQGKRTSQGDQIIRDHFTGERALFSDSSNTEKNEFRTALTFSHPDHGQEPLFCPWHGKVNHHQLPLRIHFSWPIQAVAPCYVVYVGPKLTRR